MESWKINHLGKINLDNEELSAEGKVKVKVSKALIDNTDVNLLKGEGNRYPITPSRIAIGNVSEEYLDLGLKFGERVLLSPYLATGTAHDKKVYIAPNVDTMGIDCDGFLKDFVAINRENVYLLPDSVSENEALFVENIALGVKIFSEKNALRSSSLSSTKIGINRGTLTSEYKCDMFKFNSSSCRIFAFFFLLSAISFKSSEVNIVFVASLQGDKYLLSSNSSPLLSNAKAMSSSI